MLTVDVDVVDVDDDVDYVALLGMLLLLMLLLLRCCCCVMGKCLDR
jgi:hypothetical protein